jgi:hypothetical protein
MRLTELFEDMGVLDSPSADIVNPQEDLVSAVSDIMSMAMADDITKIPTRTVQDMLRRSGYNVSTDELILALDQSGFTSSQDKKMITTKDEIPPDVVQSDYDAREPEDGNDTGVDVEKIASDQAMKDIKK